MLEGLDRPALAAHRESIRASIEAEAWNDSLRTYTDVLGGETVDASLLLMSAHGFVRASSQRMRATHAAVRERLGCGEGLLYRYERSSAAGEGAFVACGFWEVEQLARAGALAAARRTFEALLARANSSGFLAEEIDPRTGDALDNLPQAFSHVGLIRAATVLEEAARSVDVRPRPHAAAEAAP